MEEMGGVGFCGLEDGEWMRGRDDVDCCGGGEERETVFNGGFVGRD